jgi:two-component system sensor histidine kinase TctE
VRPSISRQLVLWLAVPLTLLALCGALVHYANNVAPGVISSDLRLKEATTALAALVRVDADTPRVVATDQQPMLPAADSVAYALRDSEGRLLAGNPKLPALTLRDESPQSVAVTQFGHSRVRTMTTRLETPKGALFITVADLRSATESNARYGLMSTLLWDFVQLDMTLVLVWVGVQLGLRSMKRLREQIAARSPQDLRSIDESSVPREIAPVVVTLNRLFTTLRSSAQSQQQFIANTAHQLRTPITGLQAQVDLLINEPTALPLKERMLTLQEGIRQLAHSANQLLMLARADPAVNLATKRQRVSLDKIVAEVAARYFDHALRSNIDLGVEVQPASVLADPALLDDLLSNLVDNALKYTPAGGRVTISAGEQGGKAYLQVEDNGVGIPESERQRVRQRFYRLPNSPGHGSGLGLAIVDEIAQIHDATVMIAAGEAARGTRVEVRFP